MTNETQQTSSIESQIPFGAKLQSAREAMNLDRKDAAAHLRLHEKYIDMMENDAFPKDMPAIFARGYIRAYGKLLQLSEDTIAEGLAPIQAHASTPTPAKLTPPVKKTRPTQNRKLAMRGMTAVIAITMLWMVAAWWNNRTDTPIKADAPVVATKTISTPVAAEAAATISTTPSIPAPGDLTAKMAKKPGIQIPLRAAVTSTIETAPTEAPKAPKLNQAKLPSPVSTQAANTKKALPSPVANSTVNESAYDEDDDDYYVD